MHSKLPSQKAKSDLFIFAHQDDELGVFALIESALKQGRDVLVAYMTSGSKTDEAKAQARNLESLKVLTRLGVDERNIHFLGGRLQIPDGELVYHMPIAEIAILELIQASKPIENLYVHAYEGGHEDHDACYAIAAKVLEKTSIEGFEFPMYRATLKGLLPYTVASSLPGRKVSYIPVKFAASVRYTCLATIYRTQVKAMLGLMPFFLWIWFIKRRTEILPFKHGNYAQIDRPHQGKTFYERRNSDVSFEIFRKLTASFHQANLQ